MVIAAGILLLWRILRRIVLKHSGMACVPLIVMMIVVAVRHTSVVCW